MELHSVKFIKSSPDHKTCPQEGPPEYAFAGRSNVGKSSLLNLLMNQKNLAKTSGTPGKTRLLNHFLVNESWYLVDLPGYGYARTAKKTKASFHAAIRDYLQNRTTLACLFILIDCRHRPLDNDLEFIHLAGSAQIPIALVFTKTDKLSATALQHNLEIYRNNLHQTWEVLPPIFTTSSVNQSGRDEILGFIEKSNKVFFG